MIGPKGQSGLMVAWLGWALATGVSATAYSRGSKTIDLGRVNTVKQDRISVRTMDRSFYKPEDRYEWHVKEGIRQLRAGLTVASIENFVHAAAFAPYQPYVRRLLGHAYVRAGQYHAAVDQFLRMIHLSKNPYRLEVEFQRFYSDRSQFARDVSVLAAAADADPEDAALSFLAGMYYFYREEFSQARPHLVRAVANSPENPDYLRFLRYLERE